MSYKRLFPISNVPTNVITGFLGVGKTTAILNLLKSKPEGERWAILVNEFGEVGVDGSLFTSQFTEENGYFVKEVAGGCMCCRGGVSMKVGLDQLLIKAKPDRVLVEPTGMGHPKGVLEILKSEQYQGTLSVENVITLVDARKLADPRYTEHETFNQQIAIADVVIGNKDDLYQVGDKKALQTYVENNGKGSIPVIFTTEGAFDTVLLGSKQTSTEQKAETDFFQLSAKENNANQKTTGLPNSDLPASGFIKLESQAEGLKTIGWRFSQAFVFDRNKLLSLIEKIQTEQMAERMKAVVITSDGYIAINANSDSLKVFEVESVTESRIEIIAPEVSDDWQQRLMQCLSS